MPKAIKTVNEKSKKSIISQRIPPEEMKKITDPKSFGPGAWFTIHTLAHNAQSERDKKSFERDMKIICNGIKCSTCKSHCEQYLKDNPIKDYWNLKDKEDKEVGMFQWTWAFHNAVNKRLGKKELDFDTAYYLYSDSPDTVCTKEGEEDISKSPNIPNRKNTYNTNNNYGKRFHKKNNGLISFVSKSPNVSSKKPAISFSRRY